MNIQSQQVLVQSAYLQRFPTAAITVSLGDFSFRVQPSRGRFVAGFGQIFNLTSAKLQAAALAQPTMKSTERS